MKVQLGLRIKMSDIYYFRIPVWVPLVYMADYQHHGAIYTVYASSKEAVVDEYIFMFHYLRPVE
jgi:hypothetical protein